MSAEAIFHLLKALAALAPEVIDLLSDHSDDLPVSIELAVKQVMDEKSASAIVRDTLRDQLRG